MAKLKAVLMSVVVVFLMGFFVPASPSGKPDLVVTLTLATEKYTDQNAGNITCYNVTPQYTIRNQGQAQATGFRIKLEWKPAPGRNWEVHSLIPNQTLNPGQSYTRGPNPSERTKWCEGYTDSVGFRVTADDEDVVKEGSNENNNTGTKLFPSTYPKRIIKPVQQQIIK